MAKRKRKRKSRSFEIRPEFIGIILILFGIFTEYCLLVADTHTFVVPTIFNGESAIKCRDRRSDIFFPVHRNPPCTEQGHDNESILCP